MKLGPQAKPRTARFSSVARGSYQIDQSGKIEHTSQVTVVAVANGKVKSIQIGAGEKQKLIKIMRITDFPKKIYVYRIFAALIYLLLSDEEIVFVEIDKEYPGNESVIKDTLIYLYRENKRKIPEINFTLVGKESPAHIEALAVFQRIKKPGRIIKSEEILELFYSTKKCRRSQSSRDSLQLRVSVTKTGH